MIKLSSPYRDAIRNIIEDYKDGLISHQYKVGMINGIRFCVLKDSPYYYNQGRFNAIEPNKRIIHRYWHWLCNKKSP